MAEIVVRAEVAGSVRRVLVEVGETIGPDDEPIILESMDMEVAVQVDRPGIIKAILVAEQDRVAQGQPLMLLEH